jgi:S1/P1 Nuclease
MDALRSRLMLLAAAGPLFLVAPSYAFLWDDTGHEVVARIAWDNLTPATRRKVIALLRRAPSDAGMASLRPVSGSRTVRNRVWFERAATWPDLAKSPQPTARHAYSRPPWHYRDTFWELGPDGRPQDRPDLRPDAENAVERLGVFERAVADTSRPASDRAVDLAWILHLVGDVHQPLHCEARMTDQEPQGDRGGNQFALDGDNGNLHRYWDGLLTTPYPRDSGETEDGYIGRIAAAIERAHPRAELAGQLGDHDYDAWCRSGAEIAERDVYDHLRRGEAPPHAYHEGALEIARQRIALAGYRLAAVLNDLFGS